MTSTLSPTGIITSPMRDIIQLLGFTPGKVVEKFRLDDLERGYATVYKDYLVDLKKDFKRHQGDFSYIQRRMDKHVTTMIPFSQRMLDMGLDVKVVRDPQQQAINMYMDILTKSMHGGKVR